MSQPHKPAVLQQAMQLGLGLLRRVAEQPAVQKSGADKLLQKALRGGATAGFAVASRWGSVLPKTRKAGDRLPRGAGDLFDLSPSDEQQMLVDAARAFAQQSLQPASLAADRAAGAPQALLEEAAQLGFAALAVPESLGGSPTAQPATTQALIAAALAEGDLGLAIACLGPVGVASAIARFGSAEQQAAYLPAFVDGGVVAAAIAAQEPQALFDAQAPRTTARRSGGGWVLQGQKSLVSAPTPQPLLLVSAEAEGLGLAWFLVPAETAGVTLSPSSAMGLHAASLHRLQLEGATLPQSSLLCSGVEAVQLTQLCRLAHCALGWGVGAAALEFLKGYVNERQAFGEPISHRQAVAFAVSDMAIAVESVKLATLRATALTDAGKDAAEATAIARNLLARNAPQWGSTAVQLLGGHGYTQEYPAERWYRDLAALAFLEGLVAL